MRSHHTLALLSQVLAIQAVRIIQSNDDGWAELYARSFNDALNAAGHNVVLSCPAENKSGTSSLDIEPSPRTTACQYNSCPANSGPVGFNATRPDLNWVNSYPVTAMRYGIEQFGPVRWNGLSPELAVSGPNVGRNVWYSVPFSGTVGTAVFAAGEGVPAIAFSGGDGTAAWNTSPVPVRSTVYATLSARLVAKVLESSPYLPPGIWLNVNYPDVAPGDCDNPDQFKWVLSRINPPLFSGPDVQTCGDDRLPVETTVLDADGCNIPVSVGALDKTTATKEEQAIVLKKLGSFLSCLP